MATIYKVDSKAYLQELIQYLYEDGYDWFDGVSLLNQDRIDSAWIIHKNVANTLYFLTSIQN